MSPKVALALAAVVAILWLVSALVTGNWGVMLGWIGGFASGWSVLIAVNQLANTGGDQ